MTHHRRAITTEAAPAAVGPYSQGVVAGGLVFCSGQIALEAASGELVDGGADRQATVCLQNLAAVCAAAGARLEDAVRMTVYLEDMGDFAMVNEAYAAFFPGDDPPARVAIQAAALPLGAAVEIDAVVALPD